MIFTDMVSMQAGPSRLLAPSAISMRPILRPVARSVPFRAELSRLITRPVLPHAKNTQIRGIRQYATSPPPQPYSNTEKASRRSSRLFWGTQILFGTVITFGIGFYAAAVFNATDTSRLPLDLTLMPSKLAVEQQERTQPVYGTREDYHKAIDDLRALFDRRKQEDRVSTDESDLETHGISDWSYHEEKRPTVVVWVESTEEVQEVMLIARKHRVPITPYAGATSLEGHFSSVSQGILILI